jgi:hypothetical protein
MRTVKWNPFLSGVLVLLGSALLASGSARADVSTINPAALLVFPKLEVDSSAGVNTVIQITNTSSQPASVRCFYVNANGHCSNDPDEICNAEYPPDPNDNGLRSNNCEPETDGVCVPGWIETDFRFHLTPNQPVVWNVRRGLAEFPLVTETGPTGDSNFQSSVPPAPEDPFRGELKCVLVGDDEQPIDRNWLKGEAHIVSNNGTLDLASYNAYGIQAIEGANNQDDTLILGEEYNGCPNIVEILHYFDDATEPANNDTVDTELTFVPCSQDFNLQIPKRITVQFLVFNEFEQRFSTSRPIDCLTTVPLSDIVPRPGDSDDDTSIFNVAVQGTLTGKTLARGVNDDDEDAPGGETFLVLVHKTEDNHSGAYAAHQRGSRTQTDIWQLPAAAPQ